MLNAKKLALSFLLSIAGLLLAFSVCSADTVKTPVLEGVLPGDDGSYGLPVIIGTTEPETDVLVYMDGKYVGTAEIMAQGTYENEFVYEHAPRLWYGEHSFILIARDRETLILSPPTEDYMLTVKKPIGQETVTPPETAAVPAPILVQPDADTVTGKVKPAITGLAANNTFVHIYIDGVYNGKTAMLHDPSGTDSFAYTPFLNLSRGKHTAYAVAQDSYGKKSARSNTLEFNIELPMPAPTIIKTVVNGNTDASRPFVAGLAKNDSMVKVFIDKKLDGQFQVQNHESGTANFAYKPSQALAAGTHLAYTTATDKRGKESIWSNIVYFSVKAAVTPQVSSISEVQGVKEEEEKEVSKPEKKEEEMKPAGKSDIEKILDEIKTDKEESKDAEATTSQLIQSSTKLNIAIFVIFLVGVVGWIFWVNRELVKERKEQQTESRRDDKSGKPPTITI